MHHSLKLGGTNYHFKWVKITGTVPDWKACTIYLWLYCSWNCVDCLFKDSNISCLNSII